MPSINQYEVEMKPYEVGGWWILSVFNVNDPERDITDPVAVGYLGEIDREWLGIQMAKFPIRMSAEKWVATYTESPRQVPYSVQDYILKGCKDFPFAFNTSV
jgi:hypothetical protein